MHSKASQTVLNVVITNSIKNTTFRTRGAFVIARKINIFYRHRGLTSILFFNKRVLGGGVAL